MPSTLGGVDQILMCLPQNCVFLHGVHDIFKTKDLINLKFNVNFLNKITFYVL